MKLSHREFGGTGDCPILLLHGLLGSARNWVTVGKLLSDGAPVFALDLRNHGNSPHADVMDYSLMADDVLHWMDAHSITTAHLVGHSMGGKTAMRLACSHADRVQSLTIADIAPRSYAPHFRTAFDAMHQIEPQHYRRIAEVEAALTPHLNDAAMRQFLVTNLKRNDSGTFDWQINLSAITRALPTLSESPLNTGDQYDGPSLLLHGEHSDFVLPEDHQTIRNHFPDLTSAVVPDSGHNVHVENRTFFAEQVLHLIRNS